jgi:hypothetical protein
MLLYKLGRSLLVWIPVLHSPVLLVMTSLTLLRLAIFPYLTVSMAAQVLATH